MNNWLLGLLPGPNVENEQLLIISNLRYDIFCDVREIQRLI